MSKSASNPKKRKIASTGSTEDKPSGGSLDVNNCKPSQDKSPASQFCDRCKAVIINVEKHGLGTKVLENGDFVVDIPMGDSFFYSLNLDFKLEDTYPEFPQLTASMAEGCGFCGFLKQEIIDQASTEIARLPEAADGQQVKVEIHHMKYDFAKQSTHLYGIDRLVSTALMTNSRGCTLTHELCFDIMTENGNEYTCSCFHLAASMELI